MRKNAQFMHPLTDTDEAELAALRDYGFIHQVEPDAPDWFYYDNQNNLNK